MGLFSGGTKRRILVELDFEKDGKHLDRKTKIR
jgi:hypothetical protein